MIAGHHDEGVLELAKNLQRLERLPDVAVEPLDLEVVVRHVMPDLLGVRIGRRQLDLGQIDAAGRPRLPLVSPVRIVGTQPEAEGCALRSSLEEVLE